MPQPVYVADAFTDTPFAGNPAAVVPLDGPADERWMKHVAAEMNLAETAFLYPEEGGYRLRWLTPAVEVKLCGHATLASAHVLWGTGRATAGRPIRFFTRGGELSASAIDRGIELDLPARPPQPRPAPQELLAALGTQPLSTGFADEDWFCELADERAVRSLTPDFRALKALNARGIIVTARSEKPPFDFVSRFFAPGAGVDEDPVTGSAHCALAPFWSERLGRDSLNGFQASARGGVVGVRVEGSRVKLIGRCVTVLRGELLR